MAWIGLIGRPARLGPDLRPAHPHVIPHRRVRDLTQAVLVDQPGMHPPGGMPLLARRVQILGQHRIDQHLRRLQPRRYPHPTFRAGRSAADSACRTVRRCTPYRSANPRIETSSNRASRRIASNNSTFDLTNPALHTNTAPHGRRHSAGEATQTVTTNPACRQGGAKSDRHTTAITPPTGAEPSRQGGGQMVPSSSARPASAVST